MSGSRCLARCQTDGRVTWSRSARYVDLHRTLWERVEWPPPVVRSLLCVGRPALYIGGQHAHSTSCARPDRVKKENQYASKSCRSPDKDTKNFGIARPVALSAAVCDIQAAAAAAVLCRDGVAPLARRLPHVPDAPAARCEQRTNNFTQLWHFASRARLSCTKHACAHKERFKIGLSHLSFGEKQPGRHASLYCLYCIRLS